jgi:hypothetical protein
MRGNAGMRAGFIICNQLSRRYKVMRELKGKGDEPGVPCMSVGTRCMQGGHWADER